MPFITSLRRALGGLLAFGLLTLLVFSFACGGGDDDGGDGNGGDGNGTAATPDDSGNGGPQTFDVSMTENAFDPAEFTVSTGAAVTFNLSNDGTAIHNMRVAGEDNEYNSDDDAVSDPDLVNGGDTATLEWTAADAAGEYKFQCDIHPTDMFGTITVEE